MLVLQCRTEGELYTIGAVQVPTDLDTAEAKQQLLEYFGRWHDEVEWPDSDSEFVDWLDKHTAFKSCDPPDMLCLDD